MIWNRNKSSLSIIDLYVTLQMRNNLIAYPPSLAINIPKKKGELKKLTSRSALYVKLRERRP